jgi:hypothetical protein
VVLGGFCLTTIPAGFTYITGITTHIFVPPRECSFKGYRDGIHHS